MPITLYSVREACDWLAENGRTISEKGLRKAMGRGDLIYKMVGSTYIICEDDLRSFFENPPNLGRKVKS